MRQYFLMALAAISLTACSTNGDSESSLSTAWGELTQSVTKGAITDYTDVVYLHSKENVANYSFKAVQLCKIKEGGMTEEDLIDLIQEDYNEAKKCWNSLVSYPTKDKRFHFDGTIEKEVYAEFIANAKTYKSFFVNE